MKDVDMKLCGLGISSIILFLIVYWNNIFVLRTIIIISLFIFSITFILYKMMIEEKQKEINELIKRLLKHKKRLVKTKK